MSYLFDTSLSTQSRLNIYTDYLSETNQNWLNPPLKEYANYLLKERGLSPSSVNSYLSTIRSQYRRVVLQNEFRNFVYEQATHHHAPADKKAFVDEIVQRIENAIDPAHTRVKEIKIQDESDDSHIRLTTHQANSLLQLPGTKNLKGIRDTAMIAMMLCTGVRVFELADLRVSDLACSLGEELALRIREGKGGKQRLVPYGELDWSLVITKHWLDSAGIQEGFVFRSFWKGGKTLRSNSITTRSIERVMEEYPIVIDGILRVVNPHDLRRTYARRLYDAGVELVAIKQNLGHANIATTLAYIGELDARKRRAPGFTLSRLRLSPESFHSPSVVLQHGEIACQNMLISVLWESSTSIKI